MAARRQWNDTFKMLKFFLKKLKFYEKMALKSRSTLKGKTEPFSGKQSKSCEKFSPDILNYKKYKGKFFMLKKNDSRRKDRTGGRIKNTKICK